MAAPTLYRKRSSSPMTSPIHTNPFTPIHRRRRNAQCLDNTLLVIHVHRRQWPLQLSAGNARALLRHRPFTPPPFTPIHRRRRNAQCLDNTLLVMHVHRGKGSSNSAGNVRTLLRHRPFTPPPFTPIHRRRRNAQCLDNTLLVIHVHRRQWQLQLSAGDSRAFL